MGRARPPGLAPDWTDHNAHDPGITLVELLAWVTEAQLYSLGRMRRDERAAYAALFGLTREKRGPHAASSGPMGSTPRSRRDVLAQPGDWQRRGRQRARCRDTDLPARGQALRIPGQVRRLAACLADGRVVDYLVINRRAADLAFQPLARLRKRRRTDDELECCGDDGPFPARRADADGALWPIGVRG
ncbi:MAG: hypothetical protein U1E63_15905 [Burkholderiales bacterium]